MQYTPRWVAALFLVAFLVQVVLLVVSCTFPFYLYHFQSNGKWDNQEFFLSGLKNSFYVSGQQNSTGVHFTAWSDTKFTHVGNNFIVVCFFLVVAMLFTCSGIIGALMVSISPKQYDKYNLGMYISIGALYVCLPSIIGYFLLPSCFKKDLQGTGSGGGACDYGPCTSVSGENSQSYWGYTTGFEIVIAATVLAFITHCAVGVLLWFRRHPAKSSATKNKSVDDKVTYHVI